MDCESILGYAARVCDEKSVREAGKRHDRTPESLDGK